MLSREVCNILFLPSSAQTATSHSLHTDWVENPHLPLVQSLYGCIGSIRMAGLSCIVGADAQHRAGVTAWPIGHHDHTRTLTVWDASEILLGELEEEREQQIERVTEEILRGWTQKTVSKHLVSVVANALEKRSTTFFRATLWVLSHMKGSQVATLSWYKTFSQLTFS